MNLTVRVTVDHPTLGRLRGVIPDDDNSIIEYRGIKYAEIPGRWKDPVLLNEPLSCSEFDATRYGPCCPQGAGGFEFDLSLVGNVQLVQKSLAQSELDCLNLSITVPRFSTREGQNLPVVVWVHGGGLSVGSHSWPQYSLQKFVSLSVKIGKPVIGVSFNYRLGLLGFLASDEINLHGNYGLKDQACAFKWIKRNIEGFGGDAGNVMAFGESAGAISLSTLLIANDPLFERCILMSGESTLRQIRKMSWQNAHYVKNVKMLGLGDLSPQEREIKMNTMDIVQMMERLPLFQHWSPTMDGQYLTQEVDLGLLSDPLNLIGKPNWCTAIAVGDAAQDGTILKSRFLDDPRAMEILSSAADIIFDSEEQERLLQAYRLAGMSGTDVISGLTQLVSDLRFYLPVLKVTEGWCSNKFTKCYRYHFHNLNPIEGQYKDLASHELETAYLLQHFRDYLPDESISLGEQMAEIWINFAHGLGLGDRENENGVLVIGPENRVSYISGSKYDQQYRNGSGELLQKLGWERCFKLGEILQGCHSEDV